MIYVLSQFLVLSLPFIILPHSYPSHVFLVNSFQFSLPFLLPLSLSRLLYFPCFTTYCLKQITLI